MGEGTSVTVASISELFVNDFADCFTSFFELFSTFVDFVIGQPVLMFGLTFGLVAGLTGLILKLSRRLGFKGHR